MAKEEAVGMAITQVIAGASASRQAADMAGREVAVGAGGGAEWHWSPTQSQW